MTGLDLRRFNRTFYLVLAIIIIMLVLQVGQYVLGAWSIIEAGK